MSAEFIFACIGVLCSVGIVLMCIALAVFHHERHVPDTFGDGPPDANAANNFGFCVFCDHNIHPPFSCRGGGVGACACGGTPPIDEIAAAWASACADLDEKPKRSPLGIERAEQKRSER